MSSSLPNKIRTAEDATRFRLSLVPVDTAFWDSEQKWGCGRLERLVSPATLAAYQRGWSLYRVALEEGDAAAVEQIGPKMIAALAFMDSEATAAGHKPLDPVTWETSLNDGTVLVVCRSNAEAAAVIRAANGAAHTAAPGGGVGLSANETNLPPDVHLTVRGQHEGRRLEVWTLAEIARLIEKHGSVVDRAKATWAGSDAHSGRRGEEGMAADLVRQGFPLEVPLAVPAAVASTRLAF